MALRARLSASVRTGPRGNTSTGPTAIAEHVNRPAAVRCIAARRHCAAAGRGTVRHLDDTPRHCAVVTAPAARCCRCAMCESWLIRLRTVFCSVTSALGTAARSVPTVASLKRRDGPKPLRHQCFRPMMVCSAKSRFGLHSERVRFPPHDSITHWPSCKERNGRCSDSVWLVTDPGACRACSHFDRQQTASVNLLHWRSGRVRDSTLAVSYYQVRPRASMGQMSTRRSSRTQW